VSGGVAGDTYSWQRDNTTNITGMDNVSNGAVSVPVSGSFLNLNSPSKLDSVHFLFTSATTGCTASTTVKVQKVPDVGTITVPGGATSLCQSTTTSLSIAGGLGSPSNVTWSSNNPNVTVSSSGVVTVSPTATGTVTINYNAFDASLTPPP